MSGASVDPIATVDLLDSDDDETEEEQSQGVILIDSDDDEDVIELLGSDDEEDVRIIKVTDKQQQPDAKHIIRMYVDGSHRPTGKPFNMAGGIWVQGEGLSASRILLGGQPDSCRAELGAIFAAVDFLSTFGLAGIEGRVARAAARAVAAAQAAAAANSAPSGHTQLTAVEVQILTDCQACLDMLVKTGKVKQKYRKLVESVKQLKSQLPYVVRIFKVEGHSKKNDAHALGNKRAHNLAYKCDKHQPVCKLPV